MKRILVTGDSRGLGKSICKTLHEHNSVVGISRTNPHEGWEHHDINLLENKGVELAKNLLSDIDILIHNAAIPSNNLCVVESMKKYRRVFELNTFVPIELTQHWIKNRIKYNKPGHVIFISSICTKKHFKGLSAYAASKSAINTYAKTVAVEFSKKGIRSNIILPGYMSTDMTSNMSAQHISTITNRTPMKRLSNVEEVSSVVEYIVNNPGFLNGSELTIDGGYTL
jgi:3-oxoacyl-[acyl-carrier protein] reductase